MIPAKLALSLQADGWVIRSDIIWYKKNAAPEPTDIDRPTKSHEYLYLMVKDVDYYYNGYAIKEKNTIKPSYKRSLPVGWDTDGRRGGKRKISNLHRYHNKHSVWVINTHPTKTKHSAAFPIALVTPCILAGCPENGTILDMFMGSGTVAVVAHNLNRKWIGIELNPKYIEIANRRILAILRQPMILNKNENK